MISWELFETEVSKIFYIRDHYKDVVYNIVKTKIDLNITDYYYVANKMILKLK